LLQERREKKATDVEIPGVQQGELGKLHLSSAPTLGFCMEILNKKAVRSPGSSS